MQVSLNRIRTEQNRNGTEQTRIEQSRLFQVEGTCNDHLVQLPEQFRANQKLKHVVKGNMSKCLLNSDKPGALTTSLGNLFQCLTTIVVKKCFQASSLNLPWHSFEPYPQVLSLDTWEKRSAAPSVLPLLRICREQ